MLSVQTGITAARRVFEEPTDAYRAHSAAELASIYSLLWSYYNNSLFNREVAAVGLWSAYKSAYSLYRNIRMIYNPTRRLVDFYVGMVYPGVLSTTGRQLPNGVDSAIPLSPDTPDELAAAVGQFWQWSNWQARKSVQVRYGAALGSVLVEVADDPQSGKVTAEVTWPGFVTDLELDPSGNVKRYALSYLAQDDVGTYTYGKAVDGEAFRYFRNGEPYSYGDGAVVPNPYGFVPAVWVKHMDTGSDRGSPAVAGSLSKIDELNNLVSHTHDQIHKVIGAPLVIWSGGSLANIFGTPKRGASEDMVNPAGDAEDILILRGPQGGSVDSLAGDLNLADVMLHIDKLLGEVEQDHPELVFYRELRSMSQVTGPAASRLVGDVASRISEASANYDLQNAKLFQMVAAIGGFRANAGAWGPVGSLSVQQRKFLPFNLDSYAAGELDLEILPRPLLVPTKLELAQEKQALWTAVQIAVTAGIPLEVVLRDEGWTDEQIALVHALIEAEAARRETAIQVAAQAAAAQNGGGGAPPSATRVRSVTTS